MTNKFDGNFWDIASFYNETNDGNMIPKNVGVFVLVENTWVKVEETDVMRAIAYSSGHSYSIRIYTGEILSELNLPPETQVMVVGPEDGAWLS